MARFAKRHYEAIATAMQDAQRCAEPTLGGQMFIAGIQRAIHELADVFARDNGQFSRSRFMRACEPGANVRARS